MLKCVAAANPSPTFTWNKQNEKITVGFNSTWNSSTLTITPVKDNDFTRYVCTAMNRLGWDAVTFILQEKGEYLSKNLDRVFFYRFKFNVICLLTIKWIHFKSKEKFISSRSIYLLPQPSITECFHATRTIIHTNRAKNDPAGFPSVVGAPTLRTTSLSSMILPMRFNVEMVLAMYILLCARLQRDPLSSCSP